MMPRPENGRNQEKVVARFYIRQRRGVFCSMTDELMFLDTIITGVTHVASAM